MIIADDSICVFFSVVEESFEKRKNYDVVSDGSSQLSTEMMTHYEHIKYEQTQPVAIPYECVPLEFHL